MTTIRPRTLLAHHRVLLVFVLILLFCLPSLWAGMMGDDYLHYALFQARDLPIPKPDDLSLFGLFSFINGDPDRNRQAMDLGVIPWWTYSGMKYAFWRPLAELTHWLDYRAWPRVPALMHLHNLFWYLALCFLAYRLYRKTLPSAGVALLALALYGLDSTHGFAVGWIANRNGLLAAFFGMACFAAHIRWRETASPVHRLASLLWLLLALLSAEIGISTFGYLGAYALCADPRGRVQGVLACLPSFAVILLWWIVYKSAGFGADSADAYYVDPVVQPLAFVTLFMQRYPVLLASQWGIVPAEVFGYGILSHMGYVIGCALFVVALLGWIGRRLWRDAAARLWFLGMLFSLVPTASALPQDRVLLFAGVGASAVLARFLQVIWQDRPVRGAGSRWLAGGLVLLHLVLAPLLLPVTSYSPRLFWSAMISQEPSRFAGLEKVGEKRLVLVGVPLASALAIAPFRFYRGEPVPERLWLLSSLTLPMAFQREGDRVVVVTLPSGFIQGTETSVRDFQRFPFREGETIRLDGLSIEIGALNAKGMPVRLRLHFDEPLDQGRVEFLRWDTAENRFQTMVIP